jgi:hypothetical protein
MRRLQRTSLRCSGERPVGAFGRDVSGSRKGTSEKLGLDDASIEAIIGLLGELMSEPAKVPDDVKPVSGDPDDDRVLAATIAAGAELLISGDTKHLLPLLSTDHCG